MRLEGCVERDDKMELEGSNAYCIFIRIEILPYVLTLFLIKIMLYYIYFLKEITLNIHIL